MAVLKKNKVSLNYKTCLILSWNQLNFLGKRLHKLVKPMSDPYLLYLANKNMFQLIKKKEWYHHNLYIVWVST